MRRRETEFNVSMGQLLIWLHFKVKMSSQHDAQAIQRLERDLIVIFDGFIAFVLFVVFSRLLVLDDPFDCLAICRFDYWKDASILRFEIVMKGVTKRLFRLRLLIWGLLACQPPN